MRLVASLTALLSSMALAQPTLGPPLAGTVSPVNNGPGDQTDPHVSQTTVAYTNQGLGSEIRYHHLLSGHDAAIPSSGAFDFLSDISGNTIVFTRIQGSKSSIFTFDPTTSGSPVELLPSATSNRRAAAIGGQTVVWQDLGYSTNPFESEIVVHSLGSGAFHRLTNDLLFDLDAAVSPDGEVVAWSKCLAGGLSCDVWSATWNGTGWDGRALTGAGEEEGRPDSNGVWVVYDGTRGGERDIFWQPASGGAEERLVLAGEQLNPSISGNLIAFETRESETDDWDIGLYDLTTHTYYLLTETQLNETLSDISLGEDGKVRVVWTVTEQDANVYAFTFRLEQAGECGAQAAGTGCDDPGQRPLLAELDLVRAPGKPETVLYGFSSASGTGLLCVDNQRATSGSVSINGEEVLVPSLFKHSVTHLEREVSLTLSNTVAASIVGAPLKTSYHLRIYGPPPECRQGSLAPTVVRAVESFDLVEGVRASIVKKEKITEHQIAAFEKARRGCSATGGGDVMAFLMGLIAILGRRQKK